MWSSTVVDGGLNRLVAGGNQPCSRIDRNVGWAAMSRMCYLQHMLQLVTHGFSQRAAPQDDRIVEQQQAIWHGPLA